MTTCKSFNAPKFVTSTPSRIYDIMALGAQVGLVDGLCACARVSFAKIYLSFLCCLIVSITMLWQPCLAQTPPLNLSVSAVPGGVELLFNFSYHAAGLSISRVPAWSAGQSLRLFTLFFQDGNLPPSPGGGIDPFVTAGRNYTYNVVYPANPATRGSVSIKYVPACFLVGHCPTGGRPPQYTINCKQLADFYVSASQPQASASSTTSFVGFGNVFPSPAITYACVPRPASFPFGANGITPISGLCSGFSRTVNVSNCPVNPPVRTPIRSCRQCFDNGQKCIRSGSGFICVGTAQ